MILDWDSYRSADGSFDLQELFRDYRLKQGQYSHLANNLPKAEAFLYAVEELRPVTSRQIAALALATAFSLL